MDHELFAKVIGLSKPWFVDGLDLEGRGRMATEALRAWREAEWTARAARS